GNATHERVAGENGVLEDAEALLPEALAANAVEHFDGGVRGEARPDAGGGVLFGPVEDLDELRPIGRIAQGGRARLRYGDADGIRRLPQQLLEAPIDAL